jgi:hypothetical protein
MRLCFRTILFGKISVSKYENNRRTYKHGLYKTASYLHSIFLTTEVWGGHKNVQNITDLHHEQHTTQQQHSTEHTAFQYVILFNYVLL